MFLHEWLHLYQGEGKEAQMLSEKTQVSNTQVTIIQDRQYVYLQKGYTKQYSIKEVFQWIHSSTDHHLSKNTKLWWNAQQKTLKTSEWQS